MIILRGHRRAVKDLSFSPDGRLLASADSDGPVRLWNVLGGKLETKLAPQTSDFPFTGNYRLAFSPDGRWLAIRSERDGLQIWELPSCEIKATLFKDACYGQLDKSMAFAPSGKHFIANFPPLHEAERLQCWNVSTWTRPRCLRILSLGYTFSSFAFEPAGSRLACGNGMILDFPSGRVLTKLGFVGQQLTWSPTRPLLAVWGYHSSLSIWDVDAECSIKEWQLPKRHFKGAAFSPDGRLLIAVSNEATAIQWNAANWSEQKAYAWGIGKLTCVAVSPDGMIAAAGSDRGKIVVWDLD